MNNQIPNTLFNKLGFAKDSDWIFLNESFHDFFKFLSDIVTEDNILSDQEILGWQELKKKQQFLDNDKLQNELSEINDIYPGLLNHTDDDIECLKIENQNKTKIRDSYAELVMQMEKTESDIIRENNCLQLSGVNIKKDEMFIYSQSLDNAKELQQLQKQNKILSEELQECYSKPHIPPLFMYQYSFEPYFLKHDSFLHNLNQFISENFKFENDFDQQSQDQDQAQYFMRLEKTTKRLRKFEIECMQEQIKNVGIKSICEEMNIGKINAVNLEQLEKETKELNIINNNNDTDILVNELKRLIIQSVDQKIEMILYENTKEKYECANKRLENLKILQNIVSNSLANAELLWILMQLDSEKIKNHFNNAEQLIQENQKCMKNVNILLQLQQNNLQSTLNKNYMEILCEILIKHFAGNNRIQNSNNLLTMSVKQFIEEYEKIPKSITTSYNIIAQKKNYQQILNFISEIEDEEKFLSILFDGPTKKLTLENYKFLERIYNAKTEENLIINEVGRARSDFNNNINRRMENDKLWKSYQLLWIWFLTEPKKLLSAIEEVRKVASKIPGTNKKTLCGINRVT